MATPRHAVADAADQVEDLRLRHAPAHAPEDVVVQVLERQVHVRAELRQRAVRLDQLRGEVRRVRVEQPQPAQARDLREARQQFVDARRRRAGPRRRASCPAR